MIVSCTKADKKKGTICQLTQNFSIIFDFVKKNVYL